MIFLPIVERELRAAARRHSTYSVRLLVALAAIATGALLFLFNLGRSQQLLAQYIFRGLAGLAFVYGLIAGRLSTADCLSSEKREGTLGLLFLTDLKGYDVVLGKLAATSLNGFYGLLAIFPVLALPLLMGGMTSGEFWRMVLVLVSTFFFSLAAGLVASALSRDARRAMGANFILLLLLAAALPACGGAIAYLTPAHLFISELFFPCPAYAFFLCFDTVYVARKADFWSSVAAIQGLTWGLVALASWIAPRAWRDRAAGGVRLWWRERWRRWIHGSAAARHAFRRRLLDVNAFYWLASRVRLKPAGVWAFLVFVAGWWVFVGLNSQLSIYDEAFAITTGAMLNSVLKIWVGIEALQRLAEDQKMGSLELLLSTPLSVEEIVRGQLLALKRQFLKPLLAVITIELVLMVAVSRHAYESKILMLGLAGLAMLLCDMAALVWVAMSSALTARSPNFASVSTLSRVLILPWLVYALIAIVTRTGVSLRGSPALDWKFYLWLWFWLGVLIDVGFGVPAWWRVRTRFRQLASRRFTAAARREPAA